MEGIKRFPTVSEETAAHQHSQCGTFFLRPHTLTSPHTVCHVHHTPSDTLIHKLIHTKMEQIPMHKIKIDIFKFQY